LSAEGSDPAALRLAEATTVGAAVLILTCEPTRPDRDRQAAEDQA